MVAIIQEDVAGKQIIPAGQILGIGQKLESRLGQRRAYIPGVSAGMVL